MRLTRTGTKRTRHGGSRRRTFTSARSAPYWAEKLTRQLHREHRGTA